MSGVRAEDAIGRRVTFSGKIAGVGTAELANGRCEVYLVEFDGHPGYFFPIPRMVIDERRVVVEEEPPGGA